MIGGVERSLVGENERFDHVERALLVFPDYFGDVIKKATGDTASNYIRNYIIQQAKNELASGASIAQTAYLLGFEYPQHFSRMFRKQAGIAPSEYMASIKSEK